jgi:hypothetical protein
MNNTLHIIDGRVLRLVTTVCDHYFVHVTDWDILIPNGSMADFLSAVNLKKTPDEIFEDLRAKGIEHTVLKSDTCEVPYCATRFKPPQPENGLMELYGDQ